MQKQFVIRSIRKKENSMKIVEYSRIGFMLSVALLGALTGCVGYVNGPRGEAYVATPSVYAEEGVATQDDYVYYPSYQIYYSSSRGQYVYLDGRSWVSRPTPPRVSTRVLFASPSVRLDFHDAPANHHDQIVKQYPKRWTSPSPNRSDQEERRTDHAGRH
jgi:hypothetical protein